MKKEFILNILFLLVINLLVKPLYIFGIDAQVQNTVKPEEYKLYFAFFSLAYIFQVVNDFGIHSFNSSYLSQNRAKTEYLLSNILGVKILLAFAFFCLASIAYYFLAYTLETYKLFLLVASILVLMSFSLYLRSNLTANGLFRVDSILSVTDKLLMIGILGYYLYISKASSFNIYYFVYAQIIAFAMTCLVALFVLRLEKIMISIRFSLKFLKKLVRKTFPFALIYLLMVAYSRTDGVMLERMIQNDDGYEVGAYAACYRLLDAANMFAYLFVGLLLPMLAYQIGKKQVIKPLIWLGLRIMIIVACLGAYSLIFHSNDFLSFIYDRADDYYNQVNVLLMLSFIAIAIAYIFGTSVVAEGRVMPLNAVFAAALILNIVLNLWLIPQYKALGAAYATLITQVLSLIGQIIVCQKSLKIRWSIREISQISAFMIISLVIIWLFSTFIVFNWIISLLLGIICSLIIAFLMKIIQPDEFINLLKEKVE